MQNQAIHILMVGGDARQKYLRHILETNALHVTQYDETTLPEENFSHLLLPFPAFTPDGYIRCADTPINPKEILPFLQSGTTLLGGQLGKHLRLFQATGCRCIDLAADQTLPILNAIPTAEGALDLLLRQTPETLWHRSCLVIGWGNISKVLCRLLSAVGAEITVATRQKTAAVEILSNGYRTDQTANYQTNLSDYDFIINTAPATVFSQAQFVRLARHSIYLELASAPGGLTKEMQAALQERFVAAPGLPGKIAPKTSAEFLYQAILSAIS